MSVEASSLTFSVKGPRWPERRSFVLSARNLGADGGWIGRAADCAVMLDDPDRFVSLRHARVDFANGGFWLTDDSTNGTFLNGGTTRLVRGERHALAAGDTIRVGRFDIAVMDGEAQPAYADLASPLDLASPIAPVVARDPLAGFARGSAGDPPAAAASPYPRTVPVSDPFDTLLADLGRPSDVAPLPRFADSAAPARIDPVRADGPPPAVQPTPEADQRPASSAVPPDMLSAIATEVADLSPALRQQPARPDAGTQPPQPMDTATAALAAFWCGLGIIPRSLRPEDLVDVMAELGMAFREAADGLAAMLGAMHGGAGRTRTDGGNPFAGGHSGLRRHLDEHHATAMRLDDAVREIFARAAEREAAQAEATQAGIRKMAESLSASAIEKRFGDTVRAWRPKTRRAELWRMFRLMEEDLTQLAELRFRKEVEERMRGRRPVPPHENDGFGL